MANLMDPSNVPQTHSLSQFSPLHQTILSPMAHSGAPPPPPHGHPFSRLPLTMEATNSSNINSSICAFTNPTAFSLMAGARGPDGANFLAPFAGDPSELEQQSSGSGSSRIIGLTEIIAGLPSYVPSNAPQAISVPANHLAFSPHLVAWAPTQSYVIDAPAAPMQIFLPGPYSNNFQMASTRVANYTPPVARQLAEQDLPDSPSSPTSPRFSSPEHTAPPPVGANRPTARAAPHSRIACSNFELLHSHAAHLLIVCFSVDASYAELSA